MLMCNRFNLMQIFKWTIEMVDDLLHALGEFKANMEYRNVDFNAEKAKQYEAVRKAMARRYSFGDVDLFRPQETTARRFSGVSEKRVGGKSQVRESADQKVLFQGDGKRRRIVAKI